MIMSRLLCRGAAKVGAYGPRAANAGNSSALIKFHPSPKSNSYLGELHHRSLTYSILGQSRDSGRFHYAFPSPASSHFIKNFHRTLKSTTTSSTKAGKAAEEEHEVLPDDQKEQLDLFNQTFHRIHKDVLIADANPDISQALKWFDQVLLYNVPHGKKNRGMSVVNSYRYLAPSKDSSDPQNMELARIVGWCVELLQAFFCVMDDIMDQSITRRGQLCWYRNPGVGMIALNDGLLLESAIYQLLQMHLKGKPCYIDLVELFIKTARYTEYGQCLDLLSTPPGTKPNLSTFTMERHSTIIKYKTSFYSFVLPIRCGFYLAGYSDPAVHSVAEDIGLKMGQFFQIQDDFLDCFGDPEVIGKIGTDIEDGKCAWPVVAALQRASSQQRQILEDNYSKSDPEAVRRVKAVYRDLGLEEVYRQFEEQSYQEITQQIEQLSRTHKISPKIFESYMAKLYRRNK